MEKKVKRFADLQLRFNDIEKYFTIDDILDRDIIVKDVIKRVGKYGDYVVIKYVYPGEDVNYAFSTGSEVVMNLVLEAKEKNLLPLWGQIKKVKKYYTIE